MRFILLSVLTALLVVFLNPLVPFWVVMIGILLISALLHPDGVEGFFGGGLGMGLVWLGQSVYIGIMTSSNLPQKMAELMGLDSGVYLIGITSFLGFLLGGFSGLSGVLLRRMLQKTPTDIYRG